MKQFLLLAAIFIFIACGQNKNAKTNAETTPVYVELNLKVEGMTCEHCEMSIKTGLSQLEGVDSIKANHIDSTTFVRFDSNKTNLANISAVIEERGYKVLQ